MINLDKNELKELEVIGRGSFGTVYKKDNKAYKIFNQEVRRGYSDFIKNPLLKNQNKTIRKCNRLIELNKKIIKTDLIEDLIFIDNSLAGTIMPYYDGKLFLDLRQEPLSNRIQYAKDLLETTKEINKYNIYPFDYKLINIILYNNEVKLIDLDDVLTKVTLLKNNLYYKKSIGILYETIYSFFNDGHYDIYYADLKDKIENKHRKYCRTYEELENYINNKAIKYNLLFVDNNSDLKNINLDDFKIIYTYDTLNKEIIIQTIDELNSKGIIVTDIVANNKVENYINDNSYNECIVSKEKSLLRIK